MAAGRYIFCDAQTRIPIGHNSESITFKLICFALVFVLVRKYTHTFELFVFLRNCL